LKGLNISAGLLERELKMYRLLAHPLLPQLVHGLSLSEPIELPEAQPHEDCSEGDHANRGRDPLGLT
jgi:hypothetical protein